MTDSKMPEPVAWRWKAKTWDGYWIYNPDADWLNSQSTAEIDVEPLYTHPAPVADAELDALAETAVRNWLGEMEGFATRGERFFDAVQAGDDMMPWLIAAASSALRARTAQPVGVMVKPWDTRPQGPDAMLPSTVDIHEGAWAAVIGSNGKPAGWIDTHDLFAHQIYRDRTRTALLPEGGA